MGKIWSTIKALFGIKEKKKTEEKKHLIETSSLYETRVLTKEEMEDLARARGYAASKSENSWEDID